MGQRLEVIKERSINPLALRLSTRQETYEHRGPRIVYNLLAGLSIAFNISEGTRLAKRERVQQGSDITS
jgi:hypothetical protein